MPSHRIAQVNELIRREVTYYLARNYEPPSGCLVTVEEVVTSNDLSYAKVLVSVFPPEQVKTVVRELAGKRREVWSQLRKRLTMKNIPELHFLEDQREERAARIHRLLDNREE